MKIKKLSCSLLSCPILIPLRVSIGLLLTVRLHLDLFHGRLFLLLGRRLTLVTLLPVVDLMEHIVPLPVGRVQRLLNQLLEVRTSLLITLVQQ